MIDFDKLVLGPLQAIFGRPIYVTPLASQPGQPSYWARGDYRVQNVDIPTMEGILSEQTLTMGIRRADFRIPVVGGNANGAEGAPKDQVYVPPHQGLPEAGPFWIDDTDDDAQGHSVWSLKLARPDTRNMPPLVSAPSGL